MRKRNIIASRVFVDEKLDCAHVWCNSVLSASKCITDPYIYWYYLRENKKVGYAQRLQLEGN